MSGSDYTQTPNYSLYKPVPNADNDTWGGHLNTNADTLDALIKTIENKAGVVSFNTRTGPVVLTSGDVTGALTYTPLPLAGGTLTGSLLLAADPAQLLEAATKQYVDTTASTHSTMTLDYTFQTATTAPPNSGFVRLNNVTQSAATTMWIHKIGAAGKDESLYLSLLTQGSTVILQDRDDSTREQAYTLSGPLVDSGAYVTLPVTWRQGNSALIAQRILVTLVVGSSGGGVSSFNTRTGAVVLSSGDVTTALTFAPAPLASPVFTGDPQAPTPASTDSDTSIATSAFVQAVAAPFGNNTGRNLVHNGMFNVAQRGVGPFTAISAFSLDRWKLNYSLDTMSINQVALTDADRTAIGDEAAIKALQNTFTGNAGAGAYQFLTHAIEGVQRLGGKTVTLSFWAKAASGTPKLGINIMQGFGSGGSPTGARWCLTTGATVTLATTWARYTTSIPVLSTVGTTLGTDGSDVNILGFWYSSGTTQGPTAGNIGVQSGTVQLWGVQLEIGSVATPLARRDPADELALCQRFYQTGQITNYGYIGGGMIFATTLSLRVTMRAGPTLVNGTPSTNTNLTSASISVVGTDAVQFVGTGVAAAQFAYTNTFTASADL